jgi:hypothetical protein
MLKLSKLPMRATLKFMNLYTARVSSTSFLTL